jgi:hypothetical protein
LRLDVAAVLALALEVVLPAVVRPTVRRDNSATT